MPIRELVSSKRTQDRPSKAVKVRAHLPGRRYSLRLPLELAAKIEALLEMFPTKTRSEIVRDLLDLGLTQAQRVWSGGSCASPGYHPDTRQPVYLLTGPFSEFHGLTCKHHLAMEQELTRKDPQVTYLPSDYTLGDTE